MLKYLPKIVGEFISYIVVLFLPDDEEELE